MSTTSHLSQLPSGTHSLWNDVISGTTAGLVSGLLIALTLWSINHFRRPKFEYFDIGNGLGHFHYNRLRPIVIGGAFLLDHGATMIEQNQRAGEGGHYMDAMSNRVFATSHDRRYVLEAGEEVAIAYRIAPLKMRFNSRARQDAHNILVDPLTVFNARYTGGKPAKQHKKLKRKMRHWKIAHIPFLPSATKT